MNEQAAEVWSEANSTLIMTVNNTISASRGTEEAIKVIAAALTQAKREGIEEARRIAHLCNDTRRFPGTVLSAQEFERWVDTEMDKALDRLIAETNAELGG